MLLRKILFFTTTLCGFGASYVSNGKTDLVQWDRSSLVINGNRVLIFSGEFHYPRLPVPELWLDVFEKMKANGFNAVSIYFFWSYHETVQGTLDFKSGAKNIQRLFDYAKQAGIWVLARPGPYINAETSAGGIAFWTTTGAHGVPRTGDEKYHQAWLPYITEVGKIIAYNQITNGGPVIMVQHENEYVETNYDPNDTRVTQMKQLAAAYDKAGVLVPSFHNEIGMRGVSWSTDWKNVGGAVNLYGLDSYPNGFNCANPMSGFNIVRGYYDWFQKYAYTQPSFMPEFQGGAFDPWGGSTYDNCAALTGTNFADVYYKTLIGQKITLMSLYMVFGGTNWGHAAAPVVYSSYDYGAPIGENRVVRDKMKQIKLFTLFTRVSKDLRNTHYMGAGTNFTYDAAFYTNRLVNPDTQANFYVFTQANTPSTAWATFKVDLETSLGKATISSQLDGRQAKLLVTNYNFGTQQLVYSSAEILTYSIVDKKEVIVFYANLGQFAEFVLKNYAGKVTVDGDAHKVGSAAYQGKHTKIWWTTGSGQVVVTLDNGVRAIIVDRLTGWNFWAPTLTSYPDVGAADHVLMSGPYLVRSARISGNTIYVTGDTNTTSPLEIFTSASVNTVQWNGQNVAVQRSSHGSLYAKTWLPAPANFNLPDLSSLVWHGIWSSPETEANYDDSKWVSATETGTTNPYKPNTYPVLYPDDYGFHVGSKLYRGYFDGTAAKGLTLSIMGGTATGFSVWVNGIFQSSYYGAAGTSIQNTDITFRAVTLKNKGNVVTILHDYNGHDQTAVKPNGPTNPRGILEATLTGASGLKFTWWKVQGNAGGAAGLDAVRHPFNEGGLYAERIGAHLPGATFSTYRKSPLKGLDKPGVEGYVADFKLDLPSNQDIPLAITLSAPANTHARIQLFINGYQFGKYVPHIGPQSTFPIPPGVINQNGQNRIAITIWAMDWSGGRLDGVKLVSQGNYASGFEKGFGFDAGYLQPGWTTERLNYATGGQMPKYKARGRA